MYELIHIHYIFTYTYNVETYTNYKPLSERFSGMHNISNIFFLIRWFLTATSGTKPIVVSAGHVYILLHQREK